MMILSVEYSLIGTKLAQLLFDSSVMTWQRKPISWKLLSLKIWEILSTPTNIAKGYLRNTAPESFYWRIKNVGTAQYEFVLTQGSEFVEIDTMLATIKIPDGTPSIVKKYSISDEQALLAIVRYDRLIDIFLGVTCYSLQNHLRTTVTGIGQVETDEIYVGIDKAGQQYIIPVQAKGGTDKLGISQIEQDLALCAEKYPELICRSIACQFVTRDIVAMFEFAIEEQRIVKVNERHYKIVEATEISGDDLRAYSLHI